MSSAKNSRRSAVNCRLHLSHLPFSPAAVNKRLTFVAAYITLDDGQHATAKFSNSRVWDKVPEGNILFLEIPNFNKQIKPECVNEHFLSDKNLILPYS